jgi:Flp pilus assembly protein TadD
MGEILKFPALAAKFGYKRVRKRAAPENPDQLDLFPQPTAQILDFVLESGHFNQALMFDEKGDARAADLYRRAIEAGDRVADAYCNLGIIESQKGNAANAFDCFTSSLKHDPRHTEAHFNLGNLYFDANDLRLARMHYEMTTQVTPGFPNVYFNLALAQALDNDLAAAVSSLLRYQELVPAEEGHHADELLSTLRRTLAVARNPRLGCE